MKETEDLEVDANRTFFLLRIIAAIIPNHSSIDERLGRGECTVKLQNIYDSLHEVGRFPMFLHAPDPT